MPDYQPVDAIEEIQAKSCVQPPGIEMMSPRNTCQPRSLRIVWAARWEHDKAPEVFFEAIDKLAERGFEFRLTVLGQAFENVPACFEAARSRFADRIDRWGYLGDSSDYRAALQQCDVFVSTARHEFFGMAAVEAASAGCVPVVPRRLAYPDVFDANAAVFYDPDEPESLVNVLSDLASRESDSNWWQDRSHRAAESVRQYAWPTRAPAMDDALQELLTSRSGRKIPSQRAGRNEPLSR